MLLLSREVTVLKKNRTFIHLVFALNCLTGVLLLSSRATLAQEPQKEPNKAPAPAATSSLSSTIVNTVAGGLASEAADADSMEAAQAEKADSQGPYVASLRGDRVFFLDSLPRFRFLYGANVSQPIGGENLTFASPYLGVTGGNARTKYLLQYVPTILHRWESPQTSATYQQGSLFLHREMSREWRLGFSLEGRYGDNSLRLLSEPSFGVSGGVPMINPTSFVVEPALSKLLTTDSTLDLRWRPSVRRQVDFSMQELYREANGLEGSSHSNLAGFEVSFEQSLSRRTKLIAYGDAKRVFQFQPCNSFGGGLGLSITTLRRVVFKLSGGPEFATGGACATRQGVTTQTSVSAPLGRVSRVYLSYDRSFNGLFISPRVQSRDFVGLGLQKTLTHRIDFHVEAGYYRIRQCCGFKSYEGYYISPLIGWSFDLARDTKLLVNYRSFYRQVDASGVDHNKVIVTLQWTPTPRDLTR